jgi:membrane-associated phospholipid phosphatase
MPSSSSFPSGHSAGAFAFAIGTGHVLPAAGIPLRALAALIAYSRVHTGVHYPGDVLAGALLGGAIAQATTYALDRFTCRWTASYSARPAGAETAWPLCAVGFGAPSSCDPVSQ